MVASFLVVSMEQQGAAEVVSRAAAAEGVAHTEAAMRRSPGSERTQLVQLPSDILRHILSTLSWAMLEAMAKVSVSFAEDMRERWRCCLEVMRGASVVLRTYASGLDLVRVSMPMACIAPADLLCLELHSAHDALDGESVYALRLPWTASAQLFRESAASMSYHRQEDFY